MVLADYKEKENVSILDGDEPFPYKPDPSTIKISADFNGELLPNTVSFDGTVADWIHIENKGIFEDIPCINCKDGMHIQRL